VEQNSKSDPVREDLQAAFHCGSAFPAHAPTATAFGVECSCGHPKCTWNTFCASLAAQQATEAELAREWEAEVEALKQSSPRYLAWLDQKVANLSRELELLHELARKPSAASDPEVGFLTRMARSRWGSYMSELYDRPDAASETNCHPD
jgi:hypothetical protein